MSWLVGGCVMMMVVVVLHTKCLTGRLPGRDADVTGGITYLCTYLAGYVGGGCMVVS